MVLTKLQLLQGVPVAFVFMYKDKTVAQIVSNSLTVVLVVHIKNIQVNLHIRISFFSLSTFLGDFIIYVFYIVFSITYGSK